MKKKPESLLSQEDETKQQKAEISSIEEHSNALNSPYGLIPGKSSVELEFGAGMWIDLHNECKLSAVTYSKSRSELVLKLIKFYNCGPMENGLEFIITFPNCKLLSGSKVTPLDEHDDFEDIVLIERDVPKSKYIFEVEYGDNRIKFSSSGMTVDHHPADLHDLHVLIFDYKRTGGRDLPELKQLEELIKRCPHPDFVTRMQQLIKAGKQINYEDRSGVHWFSADTDKYSFKIYHDITKSIGLDFILKDDQGEELLHYSVDTDLYPIGLAKFKNFGQDIEAEIRMFIEDLNEGNILAKRDARRPELIIPIEYNCKHLRKSRFWVTGSVVDYCKAQKMGEDFERLELK